MAWDGSRNARRPVLWAGWDLGALTTMLISSFFMSWRCNLGERIPSFFFYYFFIFHLLDPNGMGNETHERRRRIDSGFVRLRGDYLRLCVDI
ncbi:hypothetical protein EV126DRAFT_105452 [Verticillium dahliae]|nr:hypothetical protein EV126DRAFT_105452 [Verticillium dahliae]